MNAMLSHPPVSGSVKKIWKVFPKKKLIIMSGPLRQGIHKGIKISVYRQTDTHTYIDQDRQTDRQT